MTLKLTTTNISLAYLTGSEGVRANHFFSDERYKRSSSPGLARMMRTPYQSKEEFIYCARHTFVPMAVLGLGILKPILLFALPAIALGAAIILFGLANLAELAGFPKGARFMLNVSQIIIDHCAQLLVDMVLLPISALSMITRGIATGLEAMGVYEPDPIEHNYIAIF